VPIIDFGFFHVGLFNFTLEFLDEEIEELEDIIAAGECGDDGGGGVGGGRDQVDDHIRHCDDDDNESLDILLPNRDLNDFSDFDRPATKPGTIADREHRKWIEKAVPLQNNPYSKESLEKRLSRTSVDSGTSTLQSSVLTENQGGRTNDLIIASPEIPRKIDCGPKLANLRRYWRDYYVEPSRSSISSGEASEDNNSECAMTENSSKYAFIRSL
jgi:hypothetical protein